MALAPLVYTIWNRVMRFDPKDPIWPNRDRFVLSNGHASMLLWSVLYLTGTQGGERRVRAPGHSPRSRSTTSATSASSRARRRDIRNITWVSGVETTTGPLGQGIATSVGMAIARKWLASRYNRPGFEIFDYDIYAVCGDGCLMEGVGSEAASLAGHLGLDDLCWIYDNNHITIEGNTRIAFTEDVAARFLGYRWNVLRVGDANDLERMEDALKVFRTTKGRPTLIILDSHIGYGSPHKVDTAAAHGEPLGEEEVKLTKRAYGWPEDAKFLVPEAVRAHFDAGVGRRGAAGSQPLGGALCLLPGAVSGARDRDRPDAAPRAAGRLGPQPAELRRRPRGDRRPRRFGRGAEPASPRTSRGSWAAPRISGPRTRRRSNSMAPAISKPRRRAAGICISEFREHAMAAIVNGLSLSKLRAFGATFFIFSDYARPAIRLSALDGAPHDHGLHP